MKKTKNIFIIYFLFFVSLNGKSLERHSIFQGTLFKNNNKWFIFVSHKNQVATKATLEIKDIPPSMKRFLISEAFVEVQGETVACVKEKSCLSVKNIKLALLHPLKSRLK